MNEAKEDLFEIVYRVKLHGGSRNVKHYHTKTNCLSLRKAKNILKSRLGSMIAGGFERHC
jgi:hypothetical protein